MFKHWYAKKLPTDKIDAKKVAINLTNRELEPAAVSVLSKGLDFAQTVDSIANLKETISNREQAILHIPKPRRKNITKDEKRALMALQNDTNIAILLADKENATVVMLDQDYHNKMRSIFNDPLYRKLPTDPSNKIERNTFCLLKKSRILDDTVKKLSPHGVVLPRIYGVPKTHKGTCH
jgi:hypothetical protein